MALVVAGWMILPWALSAEVADPEKTEVKEEVVAEDEPKKEEEKETKEEAETPEGEAEEKPKPVDPDDEAAAEEADAEKAAVAVPVTAEPVQVYGWRENILVQGVAEKLQAKLDTGALTNSIHAEEKEMFERDGKKWMRFIVTDPGKQKPQRTRVEAPLVRIARIKEPGGESVPREVVRLSFQIGERKLRGEFTLNNRGNMLSPVLIGRTTIKELGWVDPGRTYLADKKILR